MSCRLSFCRCWAGGQAGGWAGVTLVSNMISNMLIIQLQYPYVRSVFILTQQTRHLERDGEECDEEANVQEEVGGHAG